MTKRRDNKGRILREGESQRADGRYMFRYTDISGERRSLYSYRLTETDKTPECKRNCKPLRLMEQEIRRDVWDGINTSSKVTLNERYANYINTRKDLRDTTVMHYNKVWGKHVRDTIGNIPVVDIKYSMIKRLYLTMLDEEGLSLSTVTGVHTIIHPLLQEAVHDNLIRTNPSNHVISEISKSHKPGEKRHALTIEEQNRFLQYTKEHYSFYYPFFVVLLGTGMRFGEATALQWSDVDFDNRIIHVRHTIRYTGPKYEKYTYHMNDPKTVAGVRDIPMFSEVYDALQTEKARQQKSGKCLVTVNGYSDFVFISRSRSIVNHSCMLNNFNNIGNALGIHPFSAHILRHTFCTRLCENESNVKVIQEIMGHGNISVTMNIYADVTREQKKKSFENLEGKMTLTPV